MKPHPDNRPLAATTKRRGGFRPHRGLVLVDTPQVRVGNLVSYRRVEEDQMVSYSNVEVVLLVGDSDGRLALNLEGCTMVNWRPVSPKDIEP